jgi:hypothetical protein
MYVDDMNRSCFLLPFSQQGARLLDEEIKKWLTAADIRREIVTGLKAWFEQTDTTLEAAAEDADELAMRMGTDEFYPHDSDNDSDYNSIDAERDVH